jgi:LysM repeat protein
MAARSPLRLLAPIAIAVVLVGVVVVVVSSSDGGSGDQGTARTATATTKKNVPPRRRTYRVRQGDTLTSISDKTGVSTARLIALNPGLDPQALQLGDRLKLRP